METLTPTTQETLNSVLIDMLKGVKTEGANIYTASKTALIKAVDFANEQAPQVVYEFLKWKMMEAIVYLVVGVVAIVIIGYVTYKFVKWMKKRNDYSPSPALIIPFFLLPTIIFSCIIPKTLNVIKISVAPRVYLIEYAADLYKGKNEKQ
ncbi:MAG: hypothetical protein EKK57_11375 [Proteobacteria bacterium]|nr:MAG: hypothetical protein EKK57_11375 [Pseudomonadota bacterium]